MSINRILRFVGVAALAVATAFAAPPSAGASASASPGVQSVTLHIIDLKCLFKNDPVGSDEPYINVRGTRVWQRGNVDPGETVPVQYQTAFDDVIQIDLWEDDGGLFGKDDHMATWFVFASELGTGVHRVQSPWGNIFLYDLWYEVI